jgi:hypothetical protein
MDKRLRRSIMSIPVSAMHTDVKDGFLSTAERQIESDPAWTHGTAGRDAVRLAYILWNEAGNSDLWSEAVSNYRS